MKEIEDDRVSKTKADRSWMQGEMLGGHQQERLVPCQEENAGRERVGS